MSKDLPEGLAFKDDLNLYRYCNGNLNFSTASHDDEDYGYQKKKIMRDPMSHRIIEKRRRDRMNNCLADLSRLIPPDYLKKGRGRIEKTEIIEMAIKHMRHLQNIISASRNNETQCENPVGSPSDLSTNREYGMTTANHPIVIEHYRLGYLECLSEAMHFLVEVQGYFAGDSLCVQMINHLHKHCDKILKSDLLNHPRKHGGETTSSSSSTSPPNPGYSNNSPPLGLSASNGSNSDDNQGNNPYDRGRSFEPMEDPLRNMDFSSPRRHSDISSRDSKKNCGGFYPRYSETENERVSENPSDSDVEQGYASNGRTRDSRSYLTAYEDAPKCNGVDCLPRNCSSSSGIGSNPEYSSLYDEYIVKEENGSSQLRDMLTSSKVIHLNHHNEPVQMPSIKRSTSPTSFGCDASSNPSRIGMEQYQTDALNYKTQNSSTDVEDTAPQESSCSFENNSGDTHSNMYKFKNNIKQRFSKEKRNHGSDSDNAVKKAKLSDASESNRWPLPCDNEGRKYIGDPFMKERLNLLNKDDDDCENRKHNHLFPESEMQIQSEIDSLSNRLSFGHRTEAKIKKWDDNVKFSKLKVPAFLNPETGMEYKPSENGKKHVGLLTIADYFSEQSPPHKFNSEDNERIAGIPIFALHSKGSFYIPLTLEKSVLAPFLPLLGLTKTEEMEDKPVLHPVTISVNFQPPFFVRNSKSNAVLWK